MKISTILIIALVAGAVAAADENCKDHPWAKRDLLDKVLKKGLLDGWEDTDGHLAALLGVFSSTSAALATTALTTAAHPKVRAEWVTADAKTCCTAAIYTAIEALPATLISMAQNRPSKFERALGAFGKIVKKCGRKAKKCKAGESGSGSKDDTAANTSTRFLADEATETSAAEAKECSVPEPGALSIRKLLQRLPAGPPTNKTIDESTVNPATESDQAKLEGREFKSAIELMKLFLQGKAEVFSTWVDTQRGNLMFLCRLPSNAKNSLGEKKETGPPKVDADSDAAAQKADRAGWGRLIVAVKKLTQALSQGFKIFGGPKCAKPAKEYLSRLGKTIGKQCGEKDECKEAKFKARLFSLGALKDLLVKSATGENGTGRLDDLGTADAEVLTKPRKKPTKDSASASASASGSGRRVLADAADAGEGDEATVAEANDTEAVKSVADSSQKVSFEGVDAEGNCTDKELCDYEADATLYNEEGDLAKDGLVTETTSTSEEASGTILSVAFALLAFITLF